MRGSRVVTLAFIVAISLAGCGDGATPAAAPAPSSSPSPSPSSSPSPSPSPEVVDVVPTLINDPNVPACGLYTWLDQSGPVKNLWLGFAVAVAPAGTKKEVQVSYQIEGGQSPDTATLKETQILNGQSTTGDTSAVKYLSASIGILSVDGIPSKTYAPFLTKPRIITVTVDPQNLIKESDEGNNVLKLRVTPPGNKASVAIKDNRCAKV